MTEYATYSGTDTPPDGTYLVGPKLTPIFWESGYSVGVGNILTTRDPLGASDIWALAGEPIIGVWTDTDTGLTYYDRVTRVSRYAMAMKLARRNGELAIWDNANGVAITVEYREGN